MPTLTTLVNGIAPADPALAIAANDRGLSYGDGLFETMLLRDGMVRFLSSHLSRLQAGCRRLDIGYPETALAADIAQISTTAHEGVVKVILTRGPGGRGYRPLEGAQGTRIVSLHPLPAGSGSIIARWCELRLSRNPALAGMKHLNRLEQVLAQREWNDQDIGEGLMLDTEGELVGGTASNVFIVRQGMLLTPDLRFCGVWGVMREQVLRAAAKLGLQSGEEPLWPHDLDAASEVFVTNAVRGLRSVIALDEHRWSAGPIARRLSAALGL